MLITPLSRSATTPGPMRKALLSGLLRRPSHALPRAFRAAQQPAPALRMLAPRTASPLAPKRASAALAAVKASPLRVAPIQRHFASAASSGSSQDANAYTASAFGTSASDEQHHRRPSSFKGSVVVVRRLAPAYSKRFRDVQELARGIIDILGVSRFDLAVMLSEEDEVRELNRTSLGFDTPTDVLSFPMMEPRGEMDLVEFGDVADLGELFLCIPYIEKQAAARGHTAEDELPVILLHGILHLCGFDHDYRAARDRMQGATDVVLEALHAKGLVSARQAAAASAYELDDAPEVLSEEAKEVRRKRKLSSEPSMSGVSAADSHEMPGTVMYNPTADSFRDDHDMGTPSLSSAKLAQKSDSAHAGASAATGMNPLTGADAFEPPTPETLLAAGALRADGTLDPDGLLAFLLARRPPDMTEAQVRADVAALVGGDVAELRKRTAEGLLDAADEVRAAVAAGELDEDAAVLVDGIAFGAAAAEGVRGVGKEQGEAAMSQAAAVAERRAAERAAEEAAGAGSDVEGYYTGEEGANEGEEALGAWDDDGVAEEVQDDLQGTRAKSGVTLEERVAQLEAQEQDMARALREAAAKAVRETKR